MSDKNLDIQFQKRFVPNLISNILNFIINIVIGLAMVPFFLDSLGEAAYGLVPLATSISSYMTFIISAMNQAVSRFLSVDLQRGDTKTANETYNTALFGVLGVVIILLPIAMLVAWISPSLFNIGDESALSVILLFVFVLLSVLVRTFSSTFMAVLFAHNRLDLQNWVNIPNNVVQVVLIVILFISFGASLPLVGLSYLIAAIISSTLSFVFANRVCTYLTINFKYFASKRLKEILGVTGWISLSSLAFHLRNNVGLIVANVMIGAVAGTQYSLIIAWVTLLIGISGLVTNTFTPMSYSYRAKDDKDGLTAFTLFSMKVTGLSLALPICLVCLFSPQLFTIWVGAEYAILSPIVMISIAPLIIRIQTSCADPIFQSYLRVRVPAIGCMTIGIINIILSIAIPSIFNNGLYGIAIAATISMAMVGLFILLYNSLVLQKPALTFVKPLGYGIIPIAVVLILGNCIVSLFDQVSYFEMIIIASIISIAYFIFISKVLLKKNEKIMIRNCIPKFIEKLIPTWLF